MTPKAGLRGRIAPDSAVLAGAHRALMLAATTRARGAPGTPTAAIARALRTTALGRFTPEERGWIRPVEERRRRIPASAASAEDVRLACPHWSIPRVWGRFLMRLVRELEPASAIELGAGFGISGAYQGAALDLNGHGRLLCLDREESLAEIARETIAELGLDRRVTLRMGPIGRILEDAAASAAPVDYCYIDAEHTEEATVENFERLLPYLAPGGVVVVDDIKVDDEMRRAWARIRRNSRVAHELDLRRVGIVAVDG